MVLTVSTPPTTARTTAPGPLSCVPAGHICSGTPSLASVSSSSQSASVRYALDTSFYPFLLDILSRVRELSTPMPHRREPWSETSVRHLQPTTLQETSETTMLISNSPVLRCLHHPRRWPRGILRCESSRRSGPEPTTEINHAPSYFKSYWF